MMGCMGILKKKFTDNQPEGILKWQQNVNIAGLQTSAQRICQGILTAAMNISVWIQSIASSVIRQTMARPATPVILMGVTNTAVTGNIAYIAVRQILEQPVNRVIQMAVTKGKILCMLGGENTCRPTC